MATATFVNAFPMAVAVTIGEPMNTMFVVNSNKSVTVTITPGSYTMTFSKMGNENITFNNVVLANNSTIDIKTMWLSAPASLVARSPGTLSPISLQTKCVVVNDTQSSATLTFGAAFARDNLPTLGLPVGKSLELTFNQAKPSFVIGANGRSSSVEITEAGKPVTLYITSILPNPVPSSVKYIYEGKGKGPFDVLKPGADTLSNGVNHGLNLDSYV